MVTSEVICFLPLKPILQVRPIVGKLLNALSTPSQQVRPFTTLGTGREPETKYVPQLFLGSLLGRAAQLLAIVFPCP